MDLDQLKTRVARCEGQAEQAQRQWKAAQERETALALRKGHIEVAILKIQEVAKNVQDQLRIRLQDVVQTALDVVFPGAAYVFCVDFIPRRGRTEVDMWLDKDGTRLNPLDSNGGGVVDVISLALRICCLTLSTKDRVLILDEPFKFIRGTPRNRLGAMVTALSARLGIQIIMVADVSDTGIIPDREFNVTMLHRKSLVKIQDPEASQV